MKIGVFSDVHDNLPSLEKALKMYEEANIETLIFCGDFCSPIPAKIMGKYRGQVHCVFGNGDGDRFTISRIAQNEATNLIVHGEHAEIEIAHKKIAITHYPLYGQAMARTGDYDAVFSGHTHQVHQEIFGECLWLNPGEILGWKGDPTCATYDLDSRSVDIITID